MAQVEGESACQNRPVKDTPPLTPNGGCIAPMLQLKHWREPDRVLALPGNDVPITEKDKLLRSGLGAYPNFRAYGPAKSGVTPAPNPSLSAPPFASPAVQKVPCGTFKLIEGQSL